jgi:GTP cyclohydrolase I
LEELDLEFAGCNQDRRGRLCIHFRTVPAPDGPGTQEVKNADLQKEDFMHTQVELGSNPQGDIPRPAATFPESLMIANAPGSAVAVLGTAPSAMNHRLEEIVRELLIELGVDVHDQHFRRTPARVARLYRELTQGYRVQPVEILTTFTSNHHELIVVSDINFYSLCPHHLLIYRGKMHFGYVPDGRIVGLSKIPRLIQGMAARLVVQEDLVSEIADTFMAQVKPLGCVVRATGRHDCVAVRGVKCHEAAMTTVALRGVFQEKSSLTEEFHQILSASGRS